MLVGGRNGPLVRLSLVITSPPGESETPADIVASFGTNPLGSVPIPDVQRLQAPVELDTAHSLGDPVPQRQRPSFDEEDPVGAVDEAGVVHVDHLGEGHPQRSRFGIVEVEREQKRAKAQRR